MVEWSSFIYFSSITVILWIVAIVLIYLNKSKPSIKKERGKIELILNVFEHARKNERTNRQHPDFNRIPLNIRWTRGTTNR